MIRTRWIDPEEGNSFEVVQGVDWPQMTLDQAKAALGEIEAAMAPADRRSTLGLLLQLYHATAKAGIGEAELQIKAATYAEDLGGFPGDVTQAALTMARRRFKFFPTVAELVEVCEMLTVRRRWLHRTLQGRIAMLEQPALPAPMLQRMPASGKASAVSWSPRAGNRERVARHLGITETQLLNKLVAASEEEKADLEALALRLEADAEASRTDGSL